jgi:beta-1,4-mannosyl-glycoprotein beta-1,4-N-acetylglucosaminyltransferase
MKVIDCVTYFDEPMLFEVRTNILDKYVDVFLVIEARHTHSGKDKKLNFNINNYPGIKNKIIYLVIDDEPLDLIVGKLLSSSQKRINSLKRINQSYDKALDYLKICSPDDIFILSDIDEIPNLEKLNIKKIDSKIILFKQKMFYYKFNLYYDLIPWFGSKACRVKDLKSPSFLRHTKLKKYPFWRIDTWFSKVKHHNIQIVEDGGWHFTNIKSPEKILEKYLNFGHHNEYEENQIGIDDIKKIVFEKRVGYNHLADQKNPNKISINSYKLKKISIDQLPRQIYSQKEKYKEFIED